MNSYPRPRQAIDGEWRDGSGSAEACVTDPASGAILARYPAASAADIAAALAATQAGWARWRAVPALERSAVLRQGAALLRARAALAGELLTLEQGKPRAEALREVEQAAQMLEWHAEEGRRCYGMTIPSRLPDTRFHTLPQPIGPVAAFTPWNFPVMLSAIKVGAALAAGCSVILKPPEETPAAAAVLVQCLHEAGVPAAALQLLLGVPQEISAALIAAPAIRKVSFTGSQQVGRLIGELAGRHLKPVTLELGGHAPVIVCEDADPKQAVATLAQMKFRNAGQICANPSRFLVHRKLAGAFVDAFAGVAAAVRVGSGLDPATTMGPLANARRLRAVTALVEDARGRGAQLAAGAALPAGPGFFFPPTVLWELDPAARILHEEPFGPLVPVQPFDTLDEAIAMANAVPFGLAAYGFTRDLQSARRIGEEVNAGSVGINSIALMQPETPFGGVLDGGFGRENGSLGIQAYLSIRTVATA